MAIAALVLGIVGVVFDFLYFPVGIIASIVAIILGAMGRKNTEKKGLATAGLVLGIIGVVLGLLLALACTAFAGLVGFATGLM
ncbi:MAG: DUF4190 domain-containing protein [Lachnospiraceae bacterium]|nr:DUF4190 domain-containing protein [Lachnospiraceae bacterium]